MMQFEDQLRLQAYLDGELGEGEARAVRELLARDQEAAALAAELGATRDAFQDFGKELQLPETREFYWSKIQREIQRQERALTQQAPPSRSWGSILRRVLMPVTAVAMVAFVTVMAGRHSSGGPTETWNDSGALTYHDFEKGATLVWLSYPADNDAADYESAMFD